MSSNDKKIHKKTIINFVHKCYFKYQYRKKFGREKNIPAFAIVNSKNSDHNANDKINQLYDSYAEKIVPNYKTLKELETFLVDKLGAVNYEPDLYEKERYSKTFLFNQFLNTEINMKTFDETNKSNIIIKMFGLSEIDRHIDLMYYSQSRYIEFKPDFSLIDVVFYKIVHKDKYEIKVILERHSEIKEISVDGKTEASLMPEINNIVAQIMNFQGVTESDIMSRNYKFKSYVNWLITKSNTFQENEFKL